MRAGPPRGAQSLPDIVAGAVGLYVRHARIFLVMGLPAAICSVALSLVLTSAAGGLGLNAGSDTSPANLDVSVQLLHALLAVGLILLLFIITFLTDGCIVPAALEASLKRTPKLAAIVAVWRTSFVSLLLASLLVGGALGLMFPTVLLIPVALFFFVRWSFVVQVICIEGGSARAALARSSRLVQGSWWRVLGVSLAIFVLEYLPFLALQPLNASPHNDLAGGVIIFAASWLGGPFSAIARTLLYTDVRLRKGDQGQPPQVMAG